MQETLDKTSLGGVGPGDRVNLERAVTADKRMGGHLVQGHVDGVGEIAGRRPASTGTSSRSRCRPTSASYVVDKGSITVDGVSLTVVDGRPTTRFTVSLIPETLARTTLGHKQPGDRVNLEVDVMAKHVEKLARRAYRPPYLHRSDPMSETLRLDTIERAIAEIAAGRAGRRRRRRGPGERGRPRSSPPPRPRPS